MFTACNHEMISYSDEVDLKSLMDTLPMIRSYDPNLQCCNSFLSSLYDNHHKHNHNTH